MIKATTIAEAADERAHARQVARIIADYCRPALTIHVERLAPRVWVAWIAEADAVRSGLASYRERTGRDVEPLVHYANASSAFVAACRAIVWWSGACPDDLELLR